MRLSCYFHCPTKDSRFSMWRFGSITDKHSACPTGYAIVVDLENCLWLPEQCGRVEAIRSQSPEHEILISKAIALGYRTTIRHTEFGDALDQLDTEVLPFTVRPESMLGQDRSNPFHSFLRQYDVYEGCDGEIYVRLGEHSIPGGAAFWAGCLFGLLSDAWIPVAKHPLPRNRMLSYLHLPHRFEVAEWARSNFVYALA
jgi:hypothetical protein